MINKPPLFFVLYDSINHSIFASQVIAPLLRSLEQCPEQRIMIISFEKNVVSQKLLNYYQTLHPNLSCIVCSRLPFLGRLSLIPAVVQLKKIIKRFERYSLVARGPLAGYICLRVYDKHCDSLTIQARGLLAQEYHYRYLRARSYGIKKLVHVWRFKALLGIEQWVYGTKNTTIEAVSSALEQYLIETFGSEKNNIFLAKKDIVPRLPHAQIKQWRDAIRAKLEIEPDRYVYCYNGSIKAWQCPDRVISFFKKKYIEEQKNFLLVLTPDKKEYEQLLCAADIPPACFTVLAVEHNEVYHYLAASDAGILFREEHIINWISRPVKLLEYQAIGLPVIHNNTIAYAMQNQQI